MNTTKSICVSEAIQNNKIYSIKVFSLFKTNWNRFYYFVKKIFFFLSRSFICIQNEIKVEKKERNDLCYCILLLLENNNYTNG